MNKYLVSLICFCVILILSSVCYGKETYPLGGLTREQIIEKCFKGRTLDPVEGIWDHNPDEFFIMVKTDALENQKEKYLDIDYLWIEGNSKVSNASIIYKIKKTTSPFIYQVKEKGIYFTMIPPTSMIKQWSVHGDWTEWCYSHSFPQVELR